MGSLFVKAILSLSLFTPQFVLVSKPHMVYTNAVIVFDGNSITQGTGLVDTATQTFSAQLAAIAPFNGNGNTIYNYAVSGQTTQQMTADAVAQIDSLFPVNGRGVLFAWEVTNDIYFGQTYTQAYNNYVTYCSARRSAGWKVIAVTCLPRDQPDPFNANLDSANALIRANWHTFADVLIDVRRLPQFATLAAADPTYLPDGVHPNLAGHTLFAQQLLVNAMRQVPK